MVLLVVVATSTAAVTAIDKKVNARGRKLYRSFAAEWYYIRLVSVGLLFEQNQNQITNL